MTMQPSVVIVEPDKLIRESLARRLCRAGYSATQFAHPRQALAATASRCYDVAVIAYELPEIDGVSLTESLQRRGGIGGGVIVTQEEVDLGAQRALQRGAFAVIPWCSVASELLPRLESAVESVCIKSGSHLDAESLNQPIKTAATNS